MATFAANGTSYNLSNGQYDVTLTMSESTPQPYVVNADQKITLNGNASVVLSATTNYGMILLDPFAY